MEKLSNTPHRSDDDELRLKAAWFQQGVKKLMTYASVAILVIGSIGGLFATVYGIDGGDVAVHISILHLVTLISLASWFSWNAKRYASRDHVSLHNADL